MARKPRLHVSGGLYHVMLRGNGGQDIFFDNGDRYRLYLLLQEGVERFGHRIHAFCLMTNHLHLAVQIADVSLSKIMQNLAFRYTRWVNRQQRRTGHLFQGRYKAVLVDGEAYLLELIRYIHLNPVRARLVRDPARYRWSGHRAYLGQESLPWLCTDWVLSQFATRSAVARRRYGAFVQAGINEGYREAFDFAATDPRVLGDDRFVERVLAKTNQWVGKPPRLDDLVKRVSVECGLNEAALAAKGRQRQPAQARAMIGYLAVALNSASLTEVAQRFGRDVATLSEAVGKLPARAERSTALRKSLTRLTRQLAR